MNKDKRLTDVSTSEVPSYPIAKAIGDHLWSSALACRQATFARKSASDLCIASKTIMQTWTIDCTF